MTNYGCVDAWRYEIIPKNILQKTFQAFVVISKL